MVVVDIRLRNDQRTMSIEAWITGAFLVGVAVAIAIVIAKRSWRADMGGVSADWIAQQRRDSDPSC
jgi:hypothetical protein